jgi:hypothetical protein
MTDTPLPTNNSAESLRRDIISGRGDGVNNIGDKDAANHASDKQILESFERLSEVQAKNIALVNEVRVKTEQREAKRRNEVEEDTKRRDELLQRVHHSRRNDGAALGWEQCTAATNLQDLSELLAKQKNLCESALAKLDDIGKELGSELRGKDHEYVTALKRNREEVKALQQCITNEHLMLKTAFERELKLIEDSLVADSNSILDAHKGELEALISKRKEEEAASLERQLKVIDEQRNDIKECESKGERDREELREKLENQVRRLEIELEDTRALHLFNSDKLEYNVRVLTELSENEEAVKKQKRRIMKGKEELNHKIEDNHQVRSRGIRQNDLLEADCERIEKQASRLKEKFERFKISDDEKYMAVRSMHSDDLRKLQAELKQSQEFIFGGAIGCW